MHRFDIKTIKNVELRRKTFKTTQNYKRNQITMNCIDLTSKRSKMLRYVAKLQKSSNYNELHRFDVKNIKPTQNYKSDLISMNCIDLMSKRSKQRKTKLIKLNALICRRSKNWFTNQNYKSDQISMNCIDLTI